MMWLAVLLYPTLKSRGYSHGHALMCSIMVIVGYSLSSSVVLLHRIDIYDYIMHARNESMGAVKVDKGVGKDVGLRGSISVEDDLIDTTSAGTGIIAVEPGFVLEEHPDKEEDTDANSNADAGDWISISDISATDKNFASDWADLVYGTGTSGYQE
mmetsp:Transcript_6303/g.9230  ORF Transcript_6303/g.9230 Transcript_6303/m.9230 type:complete len:156 (-) Transcript_6303:508-975(-)